MKQIYLFIILSFCTIATSFAQKNITSSDSAYLFADISLAELMKIKIVTASKIAQNANTAAATSVVITEKQIAIRGYQTLLDVLRDLPDFKVDENSSSSSGNTITIRGITGQDKFIIMLDGVRISSPTNETLPVFANYPINLAEQIEVVYGPVSAIYGADAVSGIINIISKKAFEKNLIVKASSIAGTNSYTSSSLYLNKKLTDDLNLVFSGQYLYDKQADLSKVYTANPDVNIDGYKTGTLNTIYGPIKIPGTVTPAYEAPLKGYNLYGSLRFKEFSFSAFSNYTQISSATGFKTNNSIYNKDAYLGKSVTMFNAQHIKEIKKLTFTSLLMGSRYITSPNSNYRNVFVGFVPAYKFEMGSMIKAAEQIDWKVAEKLTFIIGGTVEFFNSTPKGGDLESPTSISNGASGIYAGTRSYYRPEGIEAKIYNLAYNNIGVFSEMHYTPNKKVTLNIGGRYDNNSRYGGTLNPRAGVVVNPTDKSTVKFLFNTAFLGPSPFNAFQHYGTFTTADSGKTYTSAFMHLPNPNLKPMKSKNFEISARQFIGSNFSFTLSSYVTFLTDLIYKGADVNNMYHGQFLGNKVAVIEIPINQGKQTNYGGSVLVNYTFVLRELKVSSYSSLSYVDGTTEYNVSATETKLVQIKNIAPFIFRIGTDIIWRKLSGSVRLIAVGKQRIDWFENTQDPYERQTLNGYQLLNLSVRYRVYKGASIFVNVDNALNQKYYNVTSDLVANSQEIMRGSPQNPVRVAGGLSFVF